jgi:RNA-binding protein 39
MLLYRFLERALDKPSAPPSKDEAKEKRRSHSRSRSRERDYRRDRRDYRGRDDNRDRDRRRSSRSRERRRSRSRERRPEPTREYHIRRPREVTPPEQRLAREREKELKEMERATRTVFAYNLNLKAEERDIFKWFSQAGMVTDIQLITDKNTRKSKGIAYIEFSTQEGAITAITALNGQMFMSMPVMIKGSEVEKNLAWEAQQAAKQQAQLQHNEQATAALLMMTAPSAAGVVSIPSGLGSCRLQVSNLHPGLDESDLKQAFEPFGFLELIEIVRDANKRKQGHGFVQFREFTDGAKAIQHWHGRSLGGRSLEVHLHPPPPLLPQD